MRVLLLLSLFLLASYVSAGRKSSRTKLCLKKCRASEQQDVRCREKCAFTTQADSSVVKRRVVARAPPEDLSCLEEGRYYPVSPRSVPQCHATKFIPDCRLKRVKSNTSTVASPPSDVQINFLRGKTSEIIGRVSWTNPSDGLFEGVQIRIFDNEDGGNILRLCLEIFNSEQTTSCDVDESIMWWKPDRLYTLYMNSIPSPFNCSETATESKVVLSPACDVNRKDINPTNCLFPAPGKPDVEVNVSRGYNYANLTVSWAPRNTYLPLQKTQLVVEEKFCCSPPLMTKYIYGDVRSHVVSLLPVQGIDRYYVSVVVFTDSDKTQNSGASEQQIVTAFVPPFISDVRTATQVTSQIENTFPMLTERPTTHFKSHHTSKTAETEDANMNIVIAGSVSGVFVLISVIIIVGSIIYCQQAKHMHTTRQHFVSRTAEEVQLPPGPFCAHTDRNEVVRMVTEYQKKSNRSFSKSCAPSVSDSSSLSFLKASTGDCNRENEACLEDTHLDVTTVEIHHEMGGCSCDLFTSSNVPRVLLVYSTLNDVNAAECRNMCKVLRSAYDINVTSHEFDEDESRKNIPNWAHQHTKHADFIVFVCTKELKADFDCRNSRGFGDSQLLRSLCHFIECMYTHSRAMAEAKCIPVLLRQEDEDFVPGIMKTSVIYCWKTQKEQIIRLLAAKE